MCNWLLWNEYQKLARNRLIRPHIYQILPVGVFEFYNRVAHMLNTPYDRQADNLMLYRPCGNCYAASCAIVQLGAQVYQKP